MLLDFESAEVLVFQDRHSREILPEFTHLFDQYNLSIRVPALRQLGKRSILEFLEKAQPEHLAILSKHLNQPIDKEYLDFQVVRDLTFSLDNLCDSLCDAKSLANFSISRDQNQVKILFWR